MFVVIRLSQAEKQVAVMSKFAAIQVLYVKSYTPWSVELLLH